MLVGGEGTGDVCLSVEASCRGWEGTAACLCGGGEYPVRESAGVSTVASPLARVSIVGFESAIPALW